MVPHRKYFTLLCRRKSGKIHKNIWRCPSQILEGHNICPFELHKLVGQCIIHCDENTILAWCSHHMLSPQDNSVQLFKSYAGAKMIKPILVTLCDLSGWYFLKIVQLSLLLSSPCHLKKIAMFCTEYLAI